MTRRPLVAYLPAANQARRSFDFDQAAERLGVTVRFMRRLVDERRIPFHKIGKFVRISSSDIEVFIAGSRVEHRR